MKQVSIPWKPEGWEPAHPLDVLPLKSAMQIFRDAISNIGTVANRPAFKVVTREMEIWKREQNAVNLCHAASMSDVVLRKRVQIFPDKAGHWLS